MFRPGYFLEISIDTEGLRDLRNFETFCENAESGLRGGKWLKGLGIRAKAKVGRNAEMGCFWSIGCGVLLQTKELSKSCYICRL